MKKLTVPLPLAVLAVLALASHASAVNYRAPITITTSTWATGDTVWLADPCMVPAGEILTIQAGVKVRGSSPIGGLWVMGAIRAEGTEAQPITFAPDGDTTGAWEGIHFAGGDSSAMSCVDVTGVYYMQGMARAAQGNPYHRSKSDRAGRVARSAQSEEVYGAIGLIGEGTRLLLTNSIIHSNETIYGGGIAVQDTAKLWADGVEISGNMAGSGAGLYIYDADAVVSNSTINSNTSSGDGAGVHISGTTGPHSVVFESTEISGNSTDGTGYGGGLEVNGGVTLTMTECVVAGNYTDTNEGAGLDIWDGASARIYDSWIVYNEGAEGAGAWIEGDIQFVRTGILYNTAGHEEASEPYTGAGVIIFGGPVLFENCTVSRNYAYEGTGGQAVYRPAATTLYAGGIQIGDTSGEGGGELLGRTARGAEGADVTFLNTIVWDNYPENIVLGGSLTLESTYSDIGLLYGAVLPGTGNINADPLFNDPDYDDFSLQYGSPAIDAGDPASPRDPDGTITDMGCIPYDQTGTYQLRTGIVRESRKTLVAVPVFGTFVDASSVQMAFVFDSTVVVPDTANLVLSHAFEGLPSVEVASSRNLDTVFVAISASGTVTLSEEEVAQLVFDIVTPAAYDTTVLHWVDYPSTSVDELAAALDSGTIYTYPLYGDATGNDAVSITDASEILKSVVGLIGALDPVICDVTANGYVSSYDAALVLRKVLTASYVFPVLDNEGRRPAETGSRIVSWVQNGDSWDLVVNNPAGVFSGEFTLSSTEEPAVSGSELVFANGAGEGSMMVAFARVDDGQALLFSVTGVVTPPEILSAVLNEGQFLVAASARPLMLALDQNVPNPFNPITALTFSLPDADNARLAVFGLNGQLVRVIHDGPTSAGQHTVVWDGRDAVGRPVASGVYLYTLTTSSSTLVRRMTLVR